MKITISRNDGQIEHVFFTDSESVEIIEALETGNISLWDSQDEMSDALLKEFTKDVSPNDKT